MTFACVYNFYTSFSEGWKRRSIVPHHSSSGSDGGGISSSFSPFEFCSLSSSYDNHVELIACANVTNVLSISTSHWLLENCLPWERETIIRVTWGIET